jgi:release factor glutamine methyltransferase
MNEQIDSAISWATSRCSAVSDTPKLDAELLLAHCLGKPRSYLYSWPEKPLDSEEWQQFQALVAKRAKPTPIAYVLGEREFYSLTLKTSPATLIPRPETELLVDTAIDIIANQSVADLLELGTGTGAIAIAVKLNRPDINIVATDISTGCLDMARQNASDHAASIDWIESDWFLQIEPGRKFDMIISNPPYIAAAHPCLETGDLPAEPLSALSPGESGLEALQNIITNAPAYLNAGGYLLLEHGFDQQADVAGLMQIHGFRNIDCKLDLNQLPRVSLAHT